MGVGFHRTSKFLYNASKSGWWCVEELTRSDSLWHVGIPQLLCYSYTGLVILVNNSKSCWFLPPHGGLFIHLSEVLFVRQSFYSWNKQVWLKRDRCAEVHKNCKCVPPISSTACTPEDFSWMWVLFSWLDSFYKESFQCGKFFSPVFVETFKILTKF